MSAELPLLIQVLRKSVDELSDRLTAILLEADLLSGSKKLHEDLKPAILSIKEGAGRASSLVGRIFGIRE